MTRSLRGLHLRAFSLLKSRATRLWRIQMLSNKQKAILIRPNHHLQFRITILLIKTKWRLLSFMPLKWLLYRGQMNFLRTSMMFDAFKKFRSMSNITVTTSISLGKSFRHIGTLSMRQIRHSCQRSRPSELSTLTHLRIACRPTSFSFIRPSKMKSRESFDIWRINRNKHNMLRKLSC